MDGPEAVATAQANDVPGALVAEDLAPSIQIESDDTISYASHQNAIPLIHAVTIRNPTPNAYRNVEVLIRFDPPIAEPIFRRIELLDANSERTLSQIDLTIARKMLSDLTEAVSGSIIFEAKCGEDLLAAERRPMTVLSFDQWGGTRSVPELLCAFVAPNSPSVDRLLADAALLLTESNGNFSLNGYSDKNREAVLMQISAIFTAIARRNIQYSLPPAGFVGNGQPIRNPERVLSGGVATCLDTTVLFAACLEQAGLNPLLFLKDGHAWVGCWLLKTNFRTSITDDALTVRKRIESGEMLAIETTIVTHRQPSFRNARDSGLEHFKAESEFSYAIDLRTARNEKILPLPTLVDAAQVMPPIEQRIADFEDRVELPPLIGDGVLTEDDPVVETPTDRLNRWTSKLLDLTLRNRLLNYKASKATIPLEVVDPAQVEDEIADGKEWRFKAVPQALGADDPRSAAIRRARDGEDPVAAMLRDYASQHILVSSLDEKKLNAALNEIYLSVRTGLEESGANTLFMVIGFLRWAEDERAEKTYLAPLLLVPVTLKRASVRAGFSIVRHDDETIVNPTLLQALRDKHNVTVRGVEPPPMDDKGVDVDKVLAIFREAVKEVPRWQVIPSVSLGIFSFHKHVMYVDLKARKEALRKSRLVQHLMDRPQETFGKKDNIGFRDDLDDAYAPGTLMAPLSADSSQLNALRRAQEGRDFVMEGPPGTGKSQTITNLVVDYLASGKRVLFVSEKMAALSVVERRLSSLGLAPFCLQLHSAKAAKLEVLGQLKKTLDIAAQAEPEQWKREAETLARLRNELNGLVRALHKTYPNGLTVRGAIDIAIKHDAWPAASVNLPSVDVLTAADFDKYREIGRSCQAIAREIGELANHPLQSVRRREWSHAWEADLLAASHDLQAAVAAIKVELEGLRLPLGFEVPPLSLHGMSALHQLAIVLLEAPSIVGSVAAAADNPKACKTLGELCRVGEARNRLWAEISAVVKPDVTRLNPVELQDAWAIASSKWALPRWFALRATTGRLIPYTLNGKRPDNSQMLSILDSLVRLRIEDDKLRALESEAKNLLDDVYHGENTDWSAVSGLEEWSKRLTAVLDRFDDPADLEARSRLSRRVLELVDKHRPMLQASGGIGARLVRFHAAYQQLQKTYQTACAKSENSGLGNVDERSSSFLDAVAAAVGTWQTHKIHLRNWCLWNDYRAKAGALGLASAIVVIESGQVPCSAIEAYFDYCYQVWWLKDVMDRDQALRTFNGAVHDQKIIDFRKADETFQDLTKKVVFARLAGRVQSSVSAGTGTAEMAVLTREIQKQRAHIPIRKLVKSIPGVLSNIKPCLLMSPLSVAQYLDASQAPFDVVIFDEASQIPVWDAVGVIARGKQVIVVGDPKQLPPTSFFDKVTDGEDDAPDPEAIAPPKDLESILDECLAIGMPTLSLDWHYRSANESLIAFSNAKYYDHRLITFPSPATQDTAVRLVPVNGIYDRGATQTNRLEAEAVVKRVMSHFRNPDPRVRKLTMGVVTFNSKQQRLIEELVSAELMKQPEIEERMAEHGDEKLFVKNLENVQGDERDIILFSTTFGRDAAGRSTMNFGPLNQQGGERRLNVAVTRARREVDLYSSLRAEDIDLTKTRSKGVADLKSYLQYAERGPASLAAESSPTGREPDSPFEVEVINALRAAGFAVHPQVGCSGYRIDIGVVDQGVPGRYIVGVECDGATYHAMPCARDRDRLRQMVLEGLGWSLIRVWSTDWWLNRQRTAQELVRKVREAQALADQERATKSETAVVTEA